MVFFWLSCFSWRDSLIPFEEVVTMDDIMDKWASITLEDEEGGI